MLQLLDRLDDLLCNLKGGRAPPDFLIDIKKGLLTNKLLYQITLRREIPDILHRGRERIIRLREIRSRFDSEKPLDFPVVFLKLLCPILKGRVRIPDRLLVRRAPPAELFS